MVKKTPASPAWYKDAASLMARSSMSLKQAVGELGIGLTVEECERVYKRPEFQEIYFRELNRYRADLANTPGRNKDAAIGLMIKCVEALYQQGDFDKAIAGLDRLAKLEGWIGPDSNVNIFAGLSAKDIAEQKERILRDLADSKPKAGINRPKDGGGVDGTDIPSGNA